MTTPPRKPFYKRKRWITAGVIWLVMAYPASFGPAVYAAVRGWLAPEVEKTLNVIYEPLLTLAESGGPLGSLVGHYWTGWYELARQ